MKTLILVFAIIGLVSVGRAQSPAVEAAITKQVQSYFARGMYATGPIAVRSVKLKIDKTTPVSGSSTQYASKGTATLTVVDRGAAATAPGRTIVHSFDSVTEVDASGKGKMVEIKTH